MVFNDDPDNLVLLESILRLEGYTVSAELFGTEELTRIRSSQPALVILDCDVKQLGKGWELVQQLRMHPTTASIPVVLCIVAKATDGILAHLRTNLVILVQKPYGAMDLLLAIQEAFQLLNMPPPPDTELNA
jgi:two-component system sensor histidine kinase/response regulator